MRSICCKCHPLFVATNTTLYGTSLRTSRFYSTKRNPALKHLAWCDFRIFGRKKKPWVGQPEAAGSISAMESYLVSGHVSPHRVFHSWPPPFHPSKREQLDKCILWTKHLYCLWFCQVVSWNPCWMSVATRHLFKAEALQDLIWFSFNNWLALLFLGLRFTIDRIAFLNGQWSYWCGYKHRVSKTSGNLTSCSQTHHDGNVLNR